MKPWYTIKAAASDDAWAEVSILDAINKWYGVDARSFLTEVRALKAPNVKVYINSPGGDVVEALTIFNGLRATGKHIEAHVLGIAASAASYIAMAAHKVVMPKNTIMLPHKPSNGVYGTADEHRSAADVLDKIESLLIPAYMTRFKGTEDELKALLKEDQLLTAEECLKHGFADEVVDEVTATALWDLDMLPEAARRVFEKAKPAPAATSVTIDEVTAIAREFGVEAYAGDLAIDPRLGTLDAVRAAAREAKDVIAVCNLLGAEARGPEFVKSRVSLAEAKQTLAAARAAEADATHVDTANTSAATRGKGGGGNVLNAAAIWKDIHAMRSGSTQ